MEECPLQWSSREGWHHWSSWQSCWISFKNYQEGKWWRNYVPRQYNRRQRGLLWRGHTSKHRGELPVSELSKPRPFYHGCDAAGVECKHAYIYRDPYSVLGSTVLKRSTNQGITLKAIHCLCASLLQIIHSQLQDHSYRTTAWLSFYEPIIDADEDWNPIQDMSGWKNQMECDSHIHEVYKLPSALTEKERSDLVPYTWNLPMSEQTAILNCLNRATQRATFKNSSLIDRFIFE